MKKIAKKLKFNYKSDTFENPFQRVSARIICLLFLVYFHYFLFLKTFYANLEALVFEEEGETIEDTTLPDINFQDSKIQTYVDELTDIFGRVSYYVLSFNFMNEFDAIFYS